MRKSEKLLKSNALTFGDLIKTDLNNLSSNSPHLNLSSKGSVKIKTKTIGPHAKTYITADILD